MTNSPIRNEKQKVFQQIHLQEKAELKRGRVKEKLSPRYFLKTSLIIHLMAF
ncbi:hypothetical protein HYS72_03510 [Candidatus Pacearchaeota archaeon]|nr:hypothetical protein [Candidatus Pacearchaeota archaeon]